MINSLRPLLADCPAVLQQKWHWEHLSMLPDNAHKCEICQTQYVNNHNCTGWGHVQANPTEMLLDDCGVSRFQRCERESGRSWGTDKRLVFCMLRSVVHYQLLFHTSLKKTFVINVCNKYSVCIVWTYLEETLLKTSRPYRGHGPEKAKIQSEIAASTPFLATQIRVRKNKSKEVERERKISEKYAT